MENMNNIQDVLVRMHPGQWFSWSEPYNIDYENLIINGDYEKPTKEFLESELARLQSEYDSQAYARNRAQAYASTGDQLDMQYWDSVNDTTTWKDHVSSVKDQYPKP